MSDKPFLTHIVHLEPVSFETEERLVRVCKLYGLSLQMMVQGLQTRELRPYARDYRLLRNELVRVIGLPEDKFSEFCQEFSERKHFISIASHIREQNSSSDYHLQARAWKVSLEEAAQMMLTYYKSLVKRIKKYWKDWRKNLTKEQKTYASWLLNPKEPQFYELLDGRTPVPNPELAKTEKHRLWLETLPKDRKALFKTAKRVYRSVNQARKRISLPRTAASTNRADFDSDSWKIDPDNPQILELMDVKIDGRPPRIQVRMKGTPNLRGTLQLLRIGEGTFRIHYCREAKLEASRREGRKVGLDLGFTETFTDSDGNRHGVGFGKLLTKISDERKEKNAKRSYFHNRSRALSKSANAKDRKKAERIRKNNLGTKKRDSQRWKEKEAIKNTIRQAVNGLLRKTKDIEPIKELFIEDLTHEMKLRFSKTWNRRLAFWTRGEIVRVLEEKCSRFGVKLTRVPAPYSSRLCPICGSFHKRNRNGDKFHCRDCGFEGDSDINAAQVILYRGLHPREFPLGLSPKEVAKILEQKKRRLEEASASTVTGQTPISSCNAADGERIMM